MNERATPARAEDADVSDPGPPTIVLARYGELQLKGRNRHQFERVLARNARAACAPITRLAIHREHGQMVIVPAERSAAVARRLQQVFGFSSISPGWEAPRDPEHIARLAVALVGRALTALPVERAVPFCVRTKRADKRFPLLSTELDVLVADRVLERHGERLRVDLSNPELTLGVAVRMQAVYLFAERFAGAGGLPVESIGRAMCLLSGGIDSPVAAWMAMKRGLEVRFVNFQSTAFLGTAPREKVRRIVARLARWQRFSRLWHVPFTDIQLAVRDACPEGLRTVLYRRMMQRIATELALRSEAGAIVTGDNLGQVASQTLENLSSVQAVTPLLVLRPLVAMDKQETIEKARRIGTYDISIESVPDCCTVFQPALPALRATADEALRAEHALDVEGLVAAALEASEEELVASDATAAS